MTTGVFDGVGDHVIEGLDDELRLVALRPLQRLHDAVHHVVVSHDGHDGIWR